MAVLSNDSLKNELLNKGIPAGVDITWVNHFEALIAIDADLYMDLLFVKSDERVTGLEKLLPKPVIIHAVTNTLADLGRPFIRINAWPGFLSRQTIETAVAGQTYTGMAFAVFEMLDWPFRIVPDEPGFIAARVISMIVNEAYLAVDEGVCTKNDIDIAMKLGTNYPLGPFEWCEKIGLKNIYELLINLSKDDERYLPAKGMIKEIGD
ncbi:MAG: 3-hydroxyacyl-CoA dehydrogenase family protein [Chitinophagaceae bacterium]